MTATAPSDEPRVAVVVATRDRPALLEGLLESLVSNLRRSDEAVVVDSASRDPAVSRLVRAAGLRVVRMDRPGSSRARNAGVRATTASIVAFTDDDCLVTPGWTAAVEGAFDDHSVGFVTGRVVADRDVRLPLSLFVADERRQLRGDPAMWGAGANLAARRTAFEGVGGFDERLGPGTRLRAAEDQDLLWRLAARGWTGVFEPSSTVVHRQWRDDRASIGVSFGYGIGAGALAWRMSREGTGRAALTRRVWDDGLAAAWRELLRGYQYGAVTLVARATGTLVGAGAAALTRPTAR